MGPEWILLVIIAVAVMAYTVLGGADFGAGVWEFNTALRSTPYEKQLIYKAIGPVWEANHVWLIFVLVGLFSGFPIAFAAMCQGLFFPLLFGLTGIVFRGAAYAFRSYTPIEKTRRPWEICFALASVAAPFFLGTSAGALAEGLINVDSDARFRGSFLTGWISPFSLACGFLAVGICAYLAAVFLAREAKVMDDDRLGALWRGRALRMGILVGGVSLVTLAIGMASSDAIRDGFQQRAWPTIVASVAAGFASIELLRRNRFNWAALSASLTVATVVAGWALSQYPDLLPGQLSVLESKAPDNVIEAYLWAILIGSFLLVPSLGWLLYLFKLSGDR